MKEQFLKKRTKRELIKMATYLKINTKALPVNKLVSKLNRFSYKELKLSLNN